MGNPFNNTNARDLIVLFTKWANIKHNINELLSLLKILLKSLNMMMFVFFSIFHIIDFEEFFETSVSNIFMASQSPVIVSCGLKK